MTECTVYHNPRCSKSRQTLALLEERGITCTVVKYLETPPSAASLAGIIAALGIRPYELLRRKETEFKALNISPDTDDAAVIDAMVKHPVLIERPIVVAGDKAAIGRPPESVLSIFNA